MSRRSEHEDTPRRLKDRLKAVADEAILDAAEEVVAARGLSGAKVEEIASRAGVSVGTLYNHFTDRDALLQALVLARRREMLERLDAVLQAHAQAPFPEQLHALVEALFAHFEEHESFFAILMEGEHTRSPQAMSAVGGPRHALREVRQRCERVVERGVKEGVLRPEDAELFPTLLLGMVRACLMRRLLQGVERDAPLSQRVDQVVRFFVHGAGRQP